MKLSKKFRALVVSIVLFLGIGIFLPTVEVKADSDGNETTTFVVPKNNSYTTRGAS